MLAMLFGISGAHQHNLYRFDFTVLRIRVLQYVRINTRIFQFWSRMVQL
jgi:hypothetical protein